MLEPNRTQPKKAASEQGKAPASSLSPAATQPPAQPPAQPLQKQGKVSNSVRQISTLFPASQTTSKVTSKTTSTRPIPPEPPLPPPTSTTAATPQTSVSPPLPTAPVLHPSISAPQCTKCGNFYNPQRQQNKPQNSTPLFGIIDEFRRTMARINYNVSDVNLMNIGENPDDFRVSLVIRQKGSPNQRTAQEEAQGVVQSRNEGGAQSVGKVHRVEQMDAFSNNGSAPFGGLNLAPGGRGRRGGKGRGRPTGRTDTRRNVRILPKQTSGPSGVANNQRNTEVIGMRQPSNTTGTGQPQSSRAGKSSPIIFPEHPQWMQLYNFNQNGQLVGPPPLVRNVKAAGSNQRMAMNQASGVRNNPRNTERLMMKRQQTAKNLVTSTRQNADETIRREKASHQTIPTPNTRSPNSSTSRTNREASRGDSSLRPGLKRKRMSSPAKITTQSQFNRKSGSKQMELTQSSASAGSTQASASSSSIDSRSRASSHPKKRQRADRGLSEKSKEVQKNRFSSSARKIIGINGSVVDSILSDVNLMGGTNNPNEEVQASVSSGRSSASGNGKKASAVSSNTVLSTDFADMDNDISISDGDNAPVNGNNDSASTKNKEARVKNTEVPNTEEYDYADEERKPCQYCDRVCINDRGLKLHLSLKHKIGAPTKICALCRERHFTEADLQNHMSLHLEVKGTPCTECNAVLPNMMEVAKHYVSKHETV